MKIKEILSDFCCCFLIYVRDILILIEGIIFVVIKNQ